MSKSHQKFCKHVSFHQPLMLFYTTILHRSLVSFSLQERRQDIKKVDPAPCYVSSKCMKRFCMILWFCYLAGWWHDSHVLCFHFAPGAGNSLCYWCAGRSVPATGLEPFASFCLASTSSHLVKLLLRSLRDLNLSRSLVKKGRQTAICCYTSWLVFAPLSWVR